MTSHSRPQAAVPERFWAGPEEIGAVLAVAVNGEVRQAARGHGRSQPIEPVFVFGQRERDAVGGRFEARPAIRQFDEAVSKHVSSNDVADAQIAMGGMDLEAFGLKEGFATFEHTMSGEGHFANYLAVNFARYLAQRFLALVGGTALYRSSQPCAVL